MERHLLLDVSSWYSAFISLFYFSHSVHSYSIIPTIPAVILPVISLHSSCSAEKPRQEMKLLTCQLVSISGRVDMDHKYLLSNCC